MRTITITVEEYRGLVEDATRVEIIRGILKDDYISTKEIRNVVGERTVKPATEDDDF